MRAGRMVFALLAVLAISCHADRGATVAGTSGVSLPGRVLWAIALHPEGCGETTCQATYRVRIRNTTDQDLFVPSCEILHPPSPALATLPIASLAGLSVRARATREWTPSFQLPATPKAIHELAGATLRCSGEREPDG